METVVVAPVNDPAGNGYQDDRLDCAVVAIRAGKDVAFYPTESSVRLHEILQSNSFNHWNAFPT